ncbi:MULTISPECIES: DUF6086 family protein [unclassified Streptomyces]|uniref:DUF6086 family protein n=1 Tax=unclassified Streptomyces TaxID=2593676 RepID=UPI001EF00E42|nr:MULTISPECIES: DUF6086 family protein [unclassified Streptomyces]
MSQVSVYQADLGPPSGIGPMHADECQIDPGGFKAFVDALLAWHRRMSHAVMGAPSEGFVATVLVLAERAGIEVNCASIPPTAWTPSAWECAWAASSAAPPSWQPPPTPCATTTSAASPRTPHR